MALDRNVQAELPKHGIAHKKVYYVTAAHRNERGKPTCDRTSIGRLDEETGKVVSNWNYYEVYLKKPMPDNTGIQDCGVSDVAQKVSRKLGVTKLVHL